MLELDKVTSATFAEHVGSRFRVFHGTEALLELELFKVADLRSPWQGETPAGKRAPFSLLFRGQKAPWLVQHVYRLEHDRLGSLELFLVPVGPDESGMRYEAIFN
jgi:hypothetical protein